MRAILLHRGDSDGFDVSVVVKSEAELAHYAGLKSELRHCVTIASLMAGHGLADRVRRRWKRSAKGWTNPMFEEAFLSLGATFVYPFSSAIIASADWISDFQYYHHPEMMSAAEVRTRTLEFSTIVAHAQRIVLSSHCAQADCLAAFPQSTGRTTVMQFRTFADPAWLAADAEATTRKYHLPDRFALISNWLLPTKNHRLMLQALAQVAPAERGGLNIVCTGDIYDFRNPGFYNTFLNEISELGLRDRVAILGVIPKIDQIQLLRRSQVYLQPSLFEGWNTGVEEARMLGRSLLISDIGVHREQAPPRSTFFDPHNPADLAAKLQAAFAAPVPGGPDHERSALAGYEELQRAYGAAFMGLTDHP